MIVTILPTRNYSGGRVSPGVNVPDRVQSIRLFVESASFDDPADIITMTIEESYDSGETWEVVASNTTPGGALGRDGVTPLLPELMVEFHDDADRNPRLMRGILEVVGTVRMSVKAEVL